MKKKFVAIHEHKYGSSVYPFISSTPYNGWYSSENTDMSEFDTLFEKLGLDYDEGESVTFVEIDEEFVDVD